MAATDKPYRSQYHLDIIFGVSCVLLLLSTAWMMYDDHYRAFKPIQRKFRDVEDTLYVQQMAEKYPQDRIEDIEAAQQEAAQARALIAEEKRRLGEKVGTNPDVWLDRQKLQKAKLEASYQDTKATYDSEVSLYNIAVDERDEATDPAYKKKLAGEVEEKKKLLDKLDKELQDTQHKLTENEKTTAEALAGQKKAEDDLANIQDRLRKMTNDFDRTAKLAAQKRWKTGDWFRALPIIDGFASPYRIQQVSLEDLTIEYGSFKDVPRYDRCTTCHLAIERGSFDKPALRDLNLATKAESQGKSPAEMRQVLDQRYDDAVRFLKARTLQDESVGFDPNDLPSHYKWPVGTVAIILIVLTLGAAAGLGYWLASPGMGVMIGILGGVITAIAAGVMAAYSPRIPDGVPDLKLTASQVNQYCAHPRLDLFVDSNSPHPAEKFGCTICHAGQGSATEFSLAAHTPNNPVQRKEWQKEDDWQPTHDWEFPMLPSRFVESGCVKCHHQMTDLVRYGSKEEAPKVLRGYNLVKEFGCFGCHEISGQKSGKEVGPDLRLEPNPALEYLTPDEQAKILSDPDNPPGTMRKVGPSLRRISEKTNEGWVRKWVNSPRGFRPDTRMPHFYNVSNNHPDVLPEDQKDFPATEISSIAHYLMKESEDYLNGTDRFRKYNQARLKELEDFEKRGLLSDKQAKELVEVRRRLDLWRVPTPVAVQIVDQAGRPIPAEQIPPPGNDKDRQEGRRLFTERGCLACHSHAGTEPGVVGDAHFGPNLSRLAAKISGPNGRRWLIQWIINPNVSHPRTRMPITLTEMSPADAAKTAGQIADWLLSQTDELKDPEYQEWNKTEIPASTRDMLVNLARVYLKKAPAIDQRKVDDILMEGFTDIASEAPLMAADADEQVLKGPISDEKLKYYIGKKAVGRLGCFACHDVPGFEYAKPIGTPLNDWGKKDPARLAFEDISAYVKATYDVVELRNDPDDKKQPAKDWSKAVAEGKKPYEKFFADALNAHQREGFLHQKLEDPRSYDYHRELRWDDRLRMPQFRFAHTRREKDEGEDEFKARATMEEAEAREAVMTFILGLTAENIHARYLNRPDPDKLAEVRGRQVLEKFNCSGCHLVRSGVYEFKLTDGDTGSRALLDDSYRLVPKDKFATDHVFGNDNAWAASQPLFADRLTIHATNPRELKLKTAGGDNILSVRLSEAAQFLSLPRAKGDRLIAYGATGKAPTDDFRETLVLPAANDIRIDPTTLTGMPAPPYGGTFADLMIPYLLKKDIDRYKNEDGARGALPPPLVREGQKVQTEWLYNFLRNPTQIRPVTVLRMPKFNMSDEDARALVNYFAAADKIGNPGIGLTYPYATVHERGDVYWSEQAQRYWMRTGQSQGLQARIKQLQDDLIPAAKKAADDAKEEVGKKKAQDDVANKEAKLKVLKDLAARPADAAASLYWTDAYSLLATPGRSSCLQCHSVGTVPASELQGPPLELAFQRLRPGWTEHWIANPKRLITYDTSMPQNFPNGQVDFQELFPGSSLEQLQAARDVLMNLPKVAETPENRAYRSATSGGK
jgi:mono/diheme cytochrome c family protein